MYTLVSIQVSLPKLVMSPAANDKTLVWTTGIYKTPVEGPIWLSKLNLAGDGQADLSVHGGHDKAVMAYSADHYPYWRETLPQVNFAHGAFGENFTISGLTENTVYLDDIYDIGEARVQVSQPRQPCWKLTQKIGVRDIGRHVIKTGYSGWYFRVLQEGYVEAGQELTLIERLNPEWTITRVTRELIYGG